MSLQQRITRSIEKAIYDKLLSAGYTPDRDLYAGNESGFKDKEAEIKNTRGFCVSLFGHGVSHDRGVKFLPLISILGLGFVPGSTGNEPLAHYVLNPDELAYSKVKGTPASSNFRFEVALSSNKTSQDNFLESVRFDALPPRSQVKYWDDDTQSFLVNYSFVRQAPDFGSGLIQKIYLYEAIDVFETFSTNEMGEIAPIKQIEVVDDINQISLIE
jgi:hypothetical protein